VDTCPTGALDQPYQLDPSKCLSYLTIEEKADLPEEFNGKLNGRIYGCDICQDVCPYNRHAVPHSISELLPCRELKTYRKKDWLQLTEAKFGEIFKDSAIQRIGYEKMMSNIRNAEADPEKIQQASI
jgi:epoxyqueuosine reductase